jgi:hypothetical protein
VPTPAAAAAQAREVAVEGKEMAFTAPASVEAGLVKVNFKNAGTMAHEAALARLETGKTPQDLQAAFPQGEAAVLQLLTFVGGPNAVDPGRTASVSSALEPGVYAFLCFLPDPADGAPHVAKGMISFMNVTGQAAAVTAPKADKSIVMKDFAYDMPALAKGKQTVKLSNEGPQPHVLSLLKLGQGKTMKDVGAFLAGQAPPGPPPFSALGGSALTKGRDAYLELDLEAGNYVAICPVPDPASGKPHSELGMVKEFTIQ